MERFDSQGNVRSTKVLAYRCDCCEEVSVVLICKFVPTPADLAEHSDAEPYELVVQFEGLAAEQLSRDLIFELANPAPGYEGGIELPPIEV
jgi:hypothetical protein